jgi:hypothetical protein
MQNEKQTFFQKVNHARFHGHTQGHYESFFLPANHPTRPTAFWIRYTLFSLKALTENTIGGLWAVFFNGETNQHIVAKKEHPVGDCLFDTFAFNVHIGEAVNSVKRVKRQW